MNPNNTATLTPTGSEFKYKEPKPESFEGLIFYLRAIKRGDFKRYHGGILRIWTENVDYRVINTLEQYYDPPL